MEEDSLLSTMKAEEQGETKLIFAKSNYLFAGEIPILKKLKYLKREYFVRVAGRCCVFFEK